MLKYSTFQDMADSPPVCKDLYEVPDASDVNSKIAAHSSPRDECDRPRSFLFVLPEETSSQVAIEETKDEAEKETDLENRQGEIL